MKRTLLGLVVSVAMTGSLVAAQDGRVPSPGQSQPGQSEPGSSQPVQPRDPISSSSVTTPGEITVTGCLVEGADPNVYLLQSAKPAARSDAASSDVGSASGSSGSAAGMSSSSSSQGNVSADRTVGAGAIYRLDTLSGAKAVDFKTHVNHQVTITGMVDGDAKAAPSVAAGEKIDEKALPKFSAKSITKIADTCSAIG